MRGNGGSRVMGALAAGYSGAWSFLIAPFFMTSDGQSLIFTSTLSIIVNVQSKNTNVIDLCGCVCGGVWGCVGGERDIKGKIHHLFQNVMILYCHI